MQFIQSENVISVSSSDNLNVFQTLPTNVYTIVHDKISNTFTLKIIEKFKMPDKIYGNCKSMASRIIHTAFDRRQSTGVLLSGIAGSGKTILVKELSNTLLTKGVPTIIVNEALSSDEFFTFIQQLSTKCLIVFDEFEKVYGICDQERILTLLDGTFQTPHLFVLTVNDINRMCEHLFNRPGRIYYHLKYKGVETSVVSEVCKDFNLSKERTDQLIKISEFFSNFTFDLLFSIISEVVRYDEDPKDVIGIMNLSLRSKNKEFLFLRVLENDVDISDRINRKVAYNVLEESFVFSYTDDNDCDWDVTIEPGDLVKINNGLLVFKTTDNIVVELEESVNAPIKLELLF